MKETDGAWRREKDRQDAGRTYAQALAELPSAADEHYGAQYQAFLDAWPQRQAFLQQRGAGTQLSDETALVARLYELLNITPPE
jgi:hypothetical protein